jgi:hypothetical protein
MGYYINKTSDGQPLGRLKVEALLADGATMVDGSEFLPNLVCVVDNGIFMAAGYCYSEQEYEEFKYPDGRNKTWLVHPKAKQLSGYNH